MGEVVPFELRGQRRMEVEQELRRHKADEDEAWERVEMAQREQERCRRLLGQIGLEKGVSG